LVQADFRRHELRQQLGKLPQLEERGVRVVGKVPLREHTQTQELLVVLLQMGKVTGEQQGLVHRLVRIQLQMEYLWIDRESGPKDIRLEMNMCLVQQHCTLCRPILLVPLAPNGQR
jgi:hypothetical protein